MRGIQEYYPSVNPDYDKGAQFVFCEVPHPPPSAPSGFPLVWANSWSPIAFALYVFLIAYFLAKIVNFIRKRDRG